LTGKSNDQTDTTAVNPTAIERKISILIDTFDVEPELIRGGWRCRSRSGRRCRSSLVSSPTSTSTLAAALIERFNAAPTERFAFESRVPLPISIARVSAR
jgi:hypothetical protein